MHSVQVGMWDPQPPSKHATPLPPRTPSSSHLAHVTRVSTPAKRITFYKSGDSQFGGVRMAIHKRSFKCFDALLDDLSQKVPLPFGVRTVTTPRGTHVIKHLEQLQDGGCYLCSDQRHAKPIDMELVSKRPNIWYHYSRRPQRPEALASTPPGHLPYRQRRILLVKNTEPGVRKSVVLSRRSTRSMRAFLTEVSEAMQFHVRKLYTVEGRRIDNVQSLMTCPGVLVCVGREAFSPMLVNYIRKSSEEKLPGLGSRSPGLGPRTPGNGARSPATQGVRSPPHGAQSRASEYSEGQESKKNVNFGLETKKSIIHPRSDSSNRSARFSLSSEKSYGNGLSNYSHSKPAIMNDDIEKRVLVNKDGSLSVEMRVRFRLHQDETLQWSTQIKKSPSLTNDCCPLSQSQPPYLQQGQSESCSDPDSTSFDPEGVDYSSQHLQCALEESHCPCCYQRQEHQYDLWENPAHIYKQPPAPPVHTSSNTHTRIRHTHSSSSSSSCNSRRLVRCQARLSHCGGPEQSQLVQEEMCVTEQVQRRVEVEHNGDTHVEVCRVSQCCSRSEVVAVDNNRRPLSRKSVEDEMLEEDVERPLSGVSTSSHVLQALKEDQDDEDDDLPPSASRCCHTDEPSPSPTSQTHLNDKPRSHSNKSNNRGSRTASATSSCHCGAATPHSTTGPEVDQAPSGKASTASRKSMKIQIQTSGEEREADDEDENIKRVVTSLSCNSGQSVLSSVCPHCGGYKRGVNSRSNSRASQRSHHSPGASPNPATPLSNQENANDAHDSDDSAVSTHSNKTNLTSHGRYSAVSNIPEDRACSAMSRTSNPEQAGQQEERAPSATSAISHRSKKSQKSNSNCATAEKEKRSSSAMSHQSNLSHKSICSGTAEGPNITKERAASSLSAKTNCRDASPSDTTALEKNDTNERAHSSLSVKSNASAKSGKAVRPVSVLSAKSNVSRKSCKSHRSTGSGCAGESSPGKEADQKIVDGTGKEEETAIEERAVSATSTKSDLSAKSNKCSKSIKASERSVSPKSEGEGEERAVSQVSARSNQSNGNGNEKVDEEPEGKENEEEETQQRPETEASSQSENEGRASSALSSKSQKSNCNGEEQETEGTTGDIEKDEARVDSALSGRTTASAKSHQKNSEADVPSPDANGNQERVASAMSLKSKSSVRSRASQKSNHCTNLKSMSPSPSAVIIKTPDGFDDEGNNKTERPVSAASEKSAKSFSQKSNHTETADIAVTETADPNDDEEEDGAPRSISEKSQTLSPKRTHSPKAPAKSPVQQLLCSPGVGETRGQSALSVHSRTSAKSGRSKCNCGRASAPEKEKQREDKEVEKNEKLKSEADNEPFERACSNMSSSSKRQRRESQGTAVSGNSSGSVSLGLPEDLETGDSDSGKSNVSFHIGREETATPSVCKSTKSSIKVEVERTESQKPESANSAHLQVLKQSKREKSVKETNNGSIHSVKSSNSEKKEISSRPCSKADTGSESTLSHSLSAADLLKETMAATYPHSQKSKASKTSDKPRSEKSVKCQRKKHQNDQDEDLELTPACLPNASPIEVVSDWLRSIPANSNMLALGDELNEEEPEKEVVDEPGEVAANEEECPEAEKVDKAEEDEGEGKDVECNAAEEEKSSDPAPGVPVGRREALPKNWHSSAAVMKVLLSSSLGRCRSMPEVSPVYGRRLSMSARGLLDCLAQLQLIEPAVTPGCDKHKDQKRQYEEIMTILQSLWLTEPREIEIKDVGKDQVTPPRSSSGVGMSSGSGGSGKENGNQEGEETPPKASESLNEEQTVDPVVEEEAREAEAKEIEAEAISESDGTNMAEESVQGVPPSLDSPKTSDNPSSSDKSSANDSSNTHTDNEREALEDSSSGTPPTVLRAPLSKRLSQDPDPVWVLNLLRKLEKQFMNHYITAMAEFKVRWDLDDSLILNTMMAELKDEVSRRIQTSIEREMKKIQGRAGRGGRSPRPPQQANLSRESTMTEKRRRMLKVMKNQSVKTADSLSDGELTGDFSDQRSEDEYCPCDACVRKKMATRPLKLNPLAADAPVMMEFDLLKILQLKKTPVPAAAPQPEGGDSMAEDEEGEELEGQQEKGRSLEVVQEEEEEESKEDIKAEVVLEETIPEEDEEEQTDRGTDKGEQEEGDSLVNGELEEGGTGDEEAGEEETSEDGEEGGECQCQCAQNDSSNEEEEEGETAEGEDAEETDGEKVVGEEGETGEDETGDNEGETERGEEEAESDKEASGEGEITKNGEECEDEEGETSGQREDVPNNVENEESSLLEELGEGNVSASAEAEDEEDDGEDDGKGEESEEGGGEASEEERASPQGRLCVTEGEEADAEDSDTDGKRPSDTSADESGQKEATGDEEEEEEEEEVGDAAAEEFKQDEEGREDGGLLQQFTRASVESQPGSLEDIDTNSPPANATEVPKMATGGATGGTGQRRNRSPARAKRCKPTESDVELNS
ncbi:uncharacterized protein rp1l1a [Aulostomus maculatus]